MEVSAWVTKAQAGDDDAFLRLMDSVKERLYRIALAYLRNETEALEVLQETTCLAFQHMRKLKRPDYFQTWVVRILLNCCADVHRRERRVIWAERETSAGFAEASDTRVSLDAAIAGLTREQKEIVVLKYYQQLTITEIAAILECPEGTVKTRLHKALRALRATLGEEGLCHV